MGRKPVYDQALEKAVSFLRQRMDICQPDAVIVLGSGLGDIAQSLDVEQEIPYGEISGFVAPTTSGHLGRWILGRWSGRLVVVLQGRVHRYEGCSWEEITLPVRCAAAMGARFALFTNMNGAMNPALRPGQLLVVDDHLNFMSSCPRDLACEPSVRGIRSVYSPRLGSLLCEAASKEKIELARGVYVGVTGPNYETPAEIRAFRRLGGDVIGMSTVGEAIVASTLGLECCAISCVANMAAGVIDHPIRHDEVLETARAASADLTRLLSRFLPSF